MEIEDIRRANALAWLEQKMREYGSQSAVCERYNMSPSYLSQIKSGYTFEEKAARNFERRAGLPKHALDGYQIQTPSDGGTVHYLRPETIRNTDTAPARDEERVPVCGVWRVDAEGLIDETAYRGTEGGFVPWGGLPGARAVKVRGDSLRPMVKDGGFLIVRPGQKPEPDQNVVVGLTNGTSMVRLLVFEREETVVVETVHGQNRQTIERTDIQFMYPIVGAADAGEHRA